MTPNQQINAFYKRFKTPNNYQSLTDKQKDEYFKNLEILKQEIRDAVYTTGFISVLSKDCLLKLISPESSLRFIEPFKFLNLLSIKN